MELLNLVEFSSSDVAVESNIVRGVKVLGNRSVNVNRDGTSNVYTLEARQKAQELYEGVAVNVDHPPRTTPGAERSYRDRIGHLSNVQVRESGTFADLNLNPRHPLTEQILWDAAHAPKSVGLSHNAQGRGRADGKDFLIEEISNVRSVDIVADPATTKSLFESREDPVQSPYAAAAETKPAETKEATEAKQEAAPVEAAPVAPAPVEPVATTSDELVESLKTRIDELETKLAASERRASREKTLAESKLPAEALSEVFLSNYHGATDEAAAAMLEDRKKIWFHQRPATSAGQPVEQKYETTADFLTALGGN